MSGHTDAVGCLAFSENNQLVVSGSKDATIKVWDVYSGNCLNTMEAHSDQIWCIALFKDVIVSGSHDTMLKFWDIRSGNCVKSLKGDTYWVTSVDFSGCGRFVVSGNQGETIKLWTREKFIQNIPVRSKVWSVKFMGNLIVSAHEDKMVRVWGFN